MAQRPEPGARSGCSDALREHFRPEFLNRVDEIVIFHRAGRGSRSTRIVDVQLAGLRKRLAANGVRWS